MPPSPHWQLCKTWLIGSTVIFLILLLQTFGDKYGEHSLTAWMWLSVQLLPTGILLAVRHFAAEQFVVSEQDAKHYKFLTGSAVFYLLVVLMSLWWVHAQPPTNDWTENYRFFLRSYAYLLPLQFLIIVALVALFKRGINTVPTNPLFPDTDSTLAIKQQLLALLRENNYSDFFRIVDELHWADDISNRLRQEYLSNGGRHDINDRLETWVNGKQK